MCIGCKRELPDDRFHSDQNRCKECRSVYEKTRYQKRKEQILGRVRQYRNQNREKINKKSREKYQTDEDYRKSQHSYQNAYREEHRGEKREYAEKYRSKNRPVVNHRISLSEYKKRAEKFGDKHFCDLTHVQWIEILKRFNYRCARCGSDEDLTKDHITPICQGGKTTSSNIQPLCRSCNSKKARVEDRVFIPDPESIEIREGC